MAAVVELLQTVADLQAQASETTEESFRLIIEGPSLDETVSAVLLKIVDLMQGLNIEPPVIRAGSSRDRIDIDDLTSNFYQNESWNVVFGKSPIAALMRAREDENTLIFASKEGFHRWLNQLDPCMYPGDHFPNFAKPTTIRVHGITRTVGGPLLWVMPPDALVPSVEKADLPDSQKVHALIHTNAVKALQVCPEGYALTWGDIDAPEFAPLVRLSAIVMSACLVQELRCSDGVYEATLKGTKRLSLPLFDFDDEVGRATLELLTKAVAWVYEEKPETRLGLVMDRLSIDIESGKSLLDGMKCHLEAALSQARDSYAFVILERKDAYHKEVRELMKDMKSQADLYAVKVRDLVNALSRDTLGMLVFIVFSFIAKFDKQNFQSLLESAELALLVKALSGYLVLSFVFQAAAHWRDVHLAGKESETWLDILQHYSSQTDKENRFLDPIRKRRRTFYWALFITAIAYALLAGVTWHLPGIISDGLSLEPSSVGIGTTS